MKAAINKTTGFIITTQPEDVADSVLLDYAVAHGIPISDVEIKLLWDFEVRNLLKEEYNLTPAQVRAWVTANVTNLAQAQDAIATLAIAVGILWRDKQ